MKRIAICFSGQPRTWEKCSPTWFTLIAKLQKKFKAKVDVFCQAWDFNTTSFAAIGEHEPTQFLHFNGHPISSDEKQQFIDTMQPLDYIFENEFTSLSSVYETLNRNKRFEALRPGDPSIAWASSQFYSVMSSAHLKKKYEFEHGFRYDMCIRMRYDVFLDDAQIGCLMDCDFNKPNVNTIYSCHTRPDPTRFPFVILGDILFYADSLTFDRMCDFYRWFPVIGQRSFNQPVGTEHNLYFYAKMLNIKIAAMLADPKIFRPTDYLEKKIAIGATGELGSHELS